MPRQPKTSIFKGVATFTTSYIVRRSSNISVASDRIEVRAQLRCMNVSQINLATEMLV